MRFWTNLTISLGVRHCSRYCHTIDSGSVVQEQRVIVEFLDRDIDETRPRNSTMTRCSCTTDPESIV
jgi:hypothetical protein